MAGSNQHSRTLPVAPPVRVGLSVRVGTAGGDLLISRPLLPSPVAIAIRSVVSTPAVGPVSVLVSISIPGVGLCVRVWSASCSLIISRPLLTAPVAAPVAVRAVVTAPPIALVRVGLGVRVRSASCGLLISRPLLAAPVSSPVAVRPVVTAVTAPVAPAVSVSVRVGVGAAGGGLLLRGRGAQRQHPQHRQCNQIF